MPGNHPLGPDSDPENFHRPVGMKQHPDRQPGSTEPMSRGNYNDCNADDYFESERIDFRDLCSLIANRE